jgi:hypothetical protein
MGTREVMALYLTISSELARPRLLKSSEAPAERE